MIPSSSPQSSQWFSFVLSFFQCLSKCIMKESQRFRQIVFFMLGAPCHRALNDGSPLWIRFLCPGCCLWFGADRAIMQGIECSTEGEHGKCLVVAWTEPFRVVKEGRLPPALELPTDRRL